MATQRSTPEKPSIFVSYSHADAAHLARLRVHLRPFERLGVVELWADTKIRPGQDWRSEIRNAINRAHAAVLLVSADFLASEFIADNELPPLLAAAQERGVTVLTVILKPCAFLEISELSRFQAVNDPAKPLIAVGEAEAESMWHQVSVSIQEALEGKVELEPAVELPTSSPSLEDVGWDLRIYFGELLKDPHAVRHYLVYHYEHLDSHMFLPSAARLLEGVPNREELLKEVERHLLRNGWEGDGEIEILWLPPFVEVGVEDTYGVCVWHVKQSNNGTSFLASPVPLDFPRLLYKNSHRRRRVT